MDIKKDFGEKVRQLRKKKGFSQEEFAVKCKVHRTHMGLIENGKTNLTLENIEKLAKSLDITLEELFRGLK